MSFECHRFGRHILVGENPSHLLRELNVFGYDK